ncbi:hypothetical protein K440DRAFT_646014 [Wilcoxina mikolae CBS 423.85]|nr:hypothetical protein K440DRAFT_646014 [Wilcoxina mikolae CBS 423.85]
MDFSRFIETGMTSLGAITEGLGLRSGSSRADIMLALLWVLYSFSFKVFLTAVQSNFGTYVNDDNKVVFFVKGDFIVLDSESKMFMSANNRTYVSMSSGSPPKYSSGFSIWLSLSLFVQDAYNLQGIFNFRFIFLMTWWVTLPLPQSVSA